MSGASAKVQDATGNVRSNQKLQRLENSDRIYSSGVNYKFLRHSFAIWWCRIFHWNINDYCAVDYRCRNQTVLSSWRTQNCHLITFHSIRRWWRLCDIGSRRPPVGHPDCRMTIKIRDPTRSEPDTNSLRFISTTNVFIFPIQLYDSLLWMPRGLFYVFSISIFFNMFYLILEKFTRNLIKFSFKWPSPSMKTI